MKVLKPTTDEQSIKVIPRDYDTTLSVTLRDDQTNVTVSYTPTVTKDNDYLVFTGVFNLEEGHYYDFRVGRNVDLWQQNNDEWQAANYTWNDTQKNVETTVVDKIFCTDQEINQKEDKEYTINKGVYVSDNTYNKQYKVYER